MTGENNILETLASDGDFVVEEYRRNPLRVVLTHEKDKTIPSGLEMFVNRNGLQIEESKERSKQKNEEGDIEEYGRQKVTIGDK